MIRKILAYSFTYIIGLFLISSCRNSIESSIVFSPNKTVSLQFNLNNLGKPWYAITYNNQEVIDTSFIAFQLKDKPELKENFEITDIKKKLINTSWKPIWGEKEVIKNNYNEVRYSLTETTELKRTFDIVFRVYDDGVGFRYEFPRQENLNEVIIKEEKTQFKLTDNHDVWWIPADYDSYEYHYTKSKVSEIDVVKAGYEQRNDRYSVNLNAVNTPVTLKTKDGLYLSIHEANLTNYSGMTLAVKENFILQSELVPALDGNTVKVNTPFVTPWRTVQIEKNAIDLLNNDLIVNLNEPCELEDLSWIKPMKYNGIWWEIHIGKSTWDYGTGKHGANTENTKKYIDFATKNNISGVLVEGWNTGWEDWGDKSFNLTKPYPDFNIGEIVKYGNTKKIQLIGHHETFGNVKYYDANVEKAFKYYNKLGIKYVKTGYAAGLIPKEFHHSQYMVNHYRKVLELAAKYKINIDAHEPIKATGIRRTYPNMMTREGVKGMEYNAWGGGNPPNHTTIIPFTRGLAGPMDYTPGIFDIKFKKYRENQYVRTTLVKQLALYVVLYSPMQMVADLPENYIGNSAFNFIRDVPVDWDKIVPINGEIGEYITVARKKKKSKDWYIGSITNKEQRNFKLLLDFLDKDTKYTATIYSDGMDTDYLNNPTSYKIETTKVDAKSILEISLASGGGVAIQIKKIDTYINL